MPKATLVKEVVVQLLDRVGVLSAILTPIAEQSLNIRGINTVSLANEVQIRLIAEDPDKVVDVLKSSGYAPRVEEIIAVEVPNEAGALAQLTTKLAQAELDIRASWASPGSEANTTLYLWTANNANAVACLVS